MREFKAVWQTGTQRLSWWEVSSRGWVGFGLVFLLPGIVVNCVFHGHHINHFSKCVAVEKIPWELVPQRLGHYIVKTALKSKCFASGSTKCKICRRKLWRRFRFEDFYFPCPWCQGHQNLWLAVCPELERWDMQLEREEQAQISFACQPLKLQWSSFCNSSYFTRTASQNSFIIFKLVENNDYKHVYSYQETDFSRY